MESSQYFATLKQRLSGYFDFEADVVLCGVPIQLQAHSHRRNERYLLTKSNTLYGYDNYESFYFIQQRSATLEQLRSTVDTLTEHFYSIADPDEEHMSTDVTLVVVTDVVTQDMADYTKRFTARKLFNWGFRGRLHIGLVLVGEDDTVVYSKDRRRKHYRFLDANISRR